MDSHAKMLMQNLFFVSSRLRVSHIIWGKWYETCCNGSAGTARLSKLSWENPIHPLITTHCSAPCEARHPGACALFQLSGLSPQVSTISPETLRHFDGIAGFQTNILGGVDSYFLDIVNAHTPVA
jgi:hypothetical protein